MKHIKIALLTMLLCFSQTSRADIAGADVVVLTQILTQAIKQLIELNKIVQAGRDTLQLTRDINRGINDSLGLLQNISGTSNAGALGNLSSLSASLSHVQNLYGTAADSKVKGIQTEIDNLVAESIVKNAKVHELAGQLDQIGAQMNQKSHQVSPGGAQKMTAQGVGVMIQAMDESLRNQGTQLKMQAEELALKNHEDKEMTKHILESSSALTNSMKETKLKLETPRF